MKIDKGLLWCPGLIPGCDVYIERKDREKFEQFINNLSEFYEFENNKELEIGVTRIIPKQLRYEILSEQKWNCNICSVKLKFSINNDWSGEVAHIDHIYPFSKKDTYINGEENINERSNLQALCPKCNLNKSDKEIN